ncbi:hypothetical protein BBO99_00001108 [Phytophthora kernoviae]|uniref:Uncharacterized protein n=2 Tax=Phytophthora kernoviae TaxID=325452 RepID=A0A3R7I135_9STRA|nr:hypothetical protein G195_008936 [Phytophthora kernoviae 00238/432]KAG2516762.1 hypothetical protein JM16_007570 [Phytophthora kernoviae]KAG2519525.1 hypothetical protein JM18_007504 [Phytophthora kernoviae]RLN44033.1 hypothetical protein BBI17_007753 [Phytophthora kernoviae]RLN84678.1 hypothetical protein BBO99_00001108 [Phytophthora kernoviae]
MDAMRSYADGHRVQEMLHILLARLLETQPLDPFEFLIQTLQKDDQLDALEKKATLVRLDETRCHMQKLFPSHYRDLISWFIAHKEELPTAIPVEQFTRTCMQILGTQALT